MTSEVTLDETPRLISADKVKGTDVYNTSGEKLGSVETVMIDKVTGKVAYAVMSFGGFLGIGENYHPMPWSVLDYDTRQEGYRVDLDKRTLEDAPTIRRHEEIDWADEAWGRRLHDYYGVMPYWI